MEIIKEDLKLVDEIAPFHWFHKWSKWYRAEVEFFGSTKFIKQFRHCIICHKMQESEIRNVSST